MRFRWWRPMNSTGRSSGYRPMWPVLLLWTPIIWISMAMWKHLENRSGNLPARLKPGGKLFVRKGLPIEGITYGIEDGSDYCIRNIKIEHGTYIFDLGTPEATLTGVKFNKPGRHNLLNGLVAFAMAVQTGSPSDRLAEALETFKGVQRRFSYKIKSEAFIFIDDYAHHPTEINAVYEAISEMHPHKKTLVVFQPHLFSRTRDFADEFAESLSKFDNVILLEIYPAREKPIQGITADWLLGKISNPNKKLVDKAHLVQAIKEQRPGNTRHLGCRGYRFGNIKN